jgi:hypothetical protein
VRFKVGAAGRLKINPLLKMRNDLRSEAKDSVVVTAVRLPAVIIGMFVPLLSSTLLFGCPRCHNTI